MKPWKIIKLVKKGDYIYAKVPLHPKAIKYDYVLLHRVIVENHLGRLLLDTEIVHHKNHNKLNNDISNLQVTTNSEHASIHGRKRGKSFCRLMCPICQLVFNLPRNNSFLVKKNKYNCNTCSKRCRGILSTTITFNGINDVLKERIENCLISEFKSYPR